MACRHKFSPALFGGVETLLFGVLIWHGTNLSIEISAPSTQRARAQLVQVRRASKAFREP
jgi:hypothetical protein